MSDMIDQLAKWAEAMTIRFLWVLHATRLRRLPDLCPPQCSEGHTYLWPCRARIRKPVYSERGSHYDERYRVGSIVGVHEESDGIRVEMEIDGQGEVADRLRDILKAEPIHYTMEQRFTGFSTEKGVPTGDFRDREHIDLFPPEVYEEHHPIGVCTASKPGGWGQLSKRCTFPSNHIGPHSWTVT